jgi:hypothetical protein
MADVTEFSLTVNAELLNTLKYGLSQLPAAAQRAAQAIDAALAQAVEAAKGEPESAEPAPAPMAKTNGKHASV